ncbi:Cytochrome c [Desulfuromusa kysingii]|uniref:Cytochrome c n=1 Tax=Desulfuromusa kysingii TaxID=37625 RepID=A0A1H3W086_9BACT|nr:cytochrome c [Desulfuromusa kysingii]SDZ80469.1 Cytochrome c [Desulfuromusa kysingii]
MRTKQFKIIVLIISSLFLVTLATAADKSAQIDPTLELINVLGCKGCHTIGAEGGSLAADLTQIGSRMSAQQIKAQLIVEPADRTGGFMPSYRPLLEEDLDRISEYLYSLP